ncbi:hypothetical protein ASG73_00325 [Janibacter sp. Soil728]|nr:hypothetical protein ASG73_00325 [Janibacter sp. Soil728]
MRVAAALLSERARRREGHPVDLARERRLNSGLTDRLRVPPGVAMSHEEIAGVPVVRLSASARPRGTVLFLHGGAYALGSAEEALTWVPACTDAGADIVGVEYRLAPEHPFPAAVDDAMAVYRELLGSVPADRLVVGGNSAGGGLALLVLQRAREEGLAMPAAVILGFPWADLSLSGQSARTNLGRDMLTGSELDEEAGWFADGRDLQDPAVSPLFGSFDGFPPTWITVGSRDLLLDDSRRLATAITSAGGECVLQEWPGAVHAFTAFPLPERRRYRQKMFAVVDAVLPPHADDQTGATMTPTPDTRTPGPERGRARFAALGHTVRLIKSLPTPVRERVLDAISGGVSSALPPFPDVLRLVETAGGIPDGTLWQERLLAERPHLRGVRQREIEGDDDGRLRARLYLPPRGAGAARAALVWVHGGAFVIGSLDQKEAHWPAVELAAAGIPVLSVDYRMCIDGVHFPAPQDDVLTAWRWAVAHADEIGVQPAQLHLGGGSAGGCLVAGATVRLRDEGGTLPASLHLAYPVLEGTLAPPSPSAALALASADLLSDEWITDMFRAWSGPAPWSDPRVSPGLADLTGFPPTYLLTCGRDLLRRSSEPFAQRLRGAGVPTRHVLLDASEHAPLDRPGTADGEDAVRRLVAWLDGGFEQVGA